jgi:hypothetical protein
MAMNSALMAACFSVDCVTPGVPARLVAAGQSLK